METTTAKRRSAASRERTPGAKPRKGASPVGPSAARSADHSTSSALADVAVTSRGKTSPHGVTTALSPWCGFALAEQDALREEFLRLAQRELTESEHDFAKACVAGRDVWGEGFDPEGLPTLALALTSLTLTSLAGSTPAGSTPAARPLVVLSAERELLRARQIRFGARANCWLVDHEAPAESRAAALAKLRSFASGAARESGLFWCTLESLRDPQLRGAIAESRPLALLVEGAHAASPKAHELRPSLSLLPALRAACSGGSTSLVAFTRAVSAEVRDDAMARLGLDGSSGELRAALVQAPLVSAGTRLSIVTPQRQSGELTALVQRLPRPTAVFCATPHEADAVYAELSGAQVPVHRYHGGMPVTERATEMLHFTLPGRRAVMVATSAFQPGSGLAGVDAGPAATPEGLGLGFGRQKLRSLVHFCTPASLEQYAQELALLGALEGPTEAVMCFSPESLRKNEEAVFKLRVSDEEVSAVAEALAAARSASSALPPSSVQALEQACRIGRKATQRVLELFVDAGLVRITDGGDVRVLVSRGDLVQTVALLAADLEQLRALDGQRLDAVIAYVTSDGCRANALTSHLGAPSAAACGACDRCAPEPARTREPSQRTNDAPTMVVRRRPAAQAWSVGAASQVRLSQADPSRVADFDDDEDDDDASELVVRRAASERPASKKSRA